MSDQNWSNWIRAYDNSCNADARQRNNPSDGIQLCCKGKPLCNFCSSCGGNYPQETGVVSVDQNWPNFFRGKSDSCGGDNRVVGYNMGMKLCCQNMGNKL